MGVHNTRGKDIVFRDCDFHALTGMGFVSQFTENITYQRVNVMSNTVGRAAAEDLKFDLAKGLPWARRST